MDVRVSPGFSWVVSCAREGSRSIRAGDCGAGTRKKFPRMIPGYHEDAAQWNGAKWAVLLVLLAMLSGCDRSPFDRTEQSMDQGEQKQAARDYRGAINSYERALDGTEKTSDAHFRMAIIYAEKLNDPVSAVHHFRRYMEISPNGAHVNEAKANLARLELTLATNLAGGTLISHTEAMRLKSENSDLHKQLAARNNPAVSPSGFPLADDARTGGKPSAANKSAPGSHSYQVQPGDTLASISRKFYKTKARAKDIQDANLNADPNAAKLKTGQVLIIP